MIRSLLFSLAILITSSGCGLAGESLLSPFESSSRQPIEPGPEMRSDEYAGAWDVYTRTNDARRAAGLPTLAWNDDASQVAYEHCVDMRLREYVAHESPEGKGAADRLWEAEISYWIAGENIHHRAPAGSSAQAMEAWMASPGHRENVLDERFTHIGVGTHNDGDQSWWVQVLYAR